MTSSRYASAGRSGLLRPALLILLAAAGTGCASLDPNGGAVARDILATRQRVDQLAEEEASTRRTLDYRLGALEEKVQSRNDLLTNNLSELEKRINEQNEEIRQLRKELAELAFQFSTLATKLNMKAPEPSAQSAQMLDNSPPGQSAFDDAKRQFDLGRYDLARQGFAKSLADGASGDTAIRAQYGLAESIYRQGDLRGAYDEYTKLITNNASHILAWQSLERLAEINARQGRNAEALNLYNEILKTNPGYEGVERVKEQIRALGEAAGQPAPQPAPAAPDAAAPPAAPPAP